MRTETRIHILSVYTLYIYTHIYTLMKRQTQRHKKIQLI